MVPLRVLTLIVADPHKASVVVLEPLEPSSGGTSRVVPIWIGAHEAAQLGAAIEGMQMPRPTTHDLLLNLLDELGATINHAVVHDLKGKTYYAKLVIVHNSRRFEVDARPTDALTLALRRKVPIFIEEDLLDRASFPYVFRDPSHEEAELDKFHEFIETLSPEDFEP